jgi:hypothetical protein
MINQLAFPGLGTILAGRGIGYAQAAIMVVGFLLVMGYLVLYLGASYRYLQTPAWTQTDFEAHYRPYLWALYDGTGLCLVAWFWSLRSSLALWRQGQAAR